jgi:anti-anti-sigma factor
MTAERRLRQPCATASRVEQNRAEQNRAEQNRAEQNRAEQNRVEQNRAEQNSVEQNRVELLGVDAAFADQFGKVIVAISCYMGPCPCLIVAIEGEVDLDTAPLVQEALLRALDGTDAVCCDLSRVTFLGAAGVRALFAAGEDAAGRGRTFGVRGAHGVTRRVLTLTDPAGLIDWHR